MSSRNGVGYLACAPGASCKVLSDRTSKEPEKLLDLRDTWLRGIDPAGRNLLLCIIYELGGIEHLRVPQDGKGWHEDNIDNILKLGQDTAKLTGFIILAEPCLITPYTSRADIDSQLKQETPFAELLKSAREQMMHYLVHGIQEPKEPAQKQNGQADTVGLVPNASSNLLSLSL